MLNILITGSNGQLGSEIRALAREFPAYSITFTDIDELDITNARALDDFFSGKRFHALVNCAAYTAVDKAEQEKELARLVNVEAVKNLTEAAVNHHIFPVHISTDYVFGGNSDRPYRENDIPDPGSEYGRTKLEGEQVFYLATNKGLIIRTSWLYSSFGRNFVKTILSKGAEKGELRVVDDQVGCPTYARDLARVILTILPAAIDRGTKEIYHYSNEGSCSWYDLADEAIALSGIPCKVMPIRTVEYPTPAARPMYSILDKEKIKTDFGISIPHWKESLEDCIKLISVTA